MAAKLLLVALTATTLCSYAAAQLAGGATSVNNYLSGNTAHPQGLIARYNAAHPTATFPAYASVGSGTGIKGFSNGTYAVGFSDDPMSAAQDAAAPKKFTLPLTLGTYSFVTKKAQGLQLTGRQLARIYLGQIKRWRGVKKGAKGFIVPVCRADSSGTTELITKYLLASYSGWPASYTSTATLLGGPFSSRLTGVTGSGGVAAYVAAHKNAIGYVQSGIATTVGAYEIGISNPAGAFVFAVNADPTQSIPTTLPAYGASWAGVSLLDKTGAGTYPIASFVYMFARKNYRTSFPTQGKLIKKFLYYTQTNAAANVGSDYFFFAIPSTIRQKTQKAVLRIRVKG